MSLILEVVDAQGVRLRQRLRELPLTVGRGLHNDIVLDDPYVDARHARIAIDDSGALAIEDLGSVNGVLADAVRLASPLALRAGLEVRIGRTTLRFRDPDEPVAPALVDESVPRHAAARVLAATGPSRASSQDAPPLAPPSLTPPVPAPSWSPVLAPPPVHTNGAAALPDAPPRPRRLADRVAAFSRTTPGRLAILALALLTFAAYSAAGSIARSSASDAFAGAMAFAMLAVMWAGIWAVASRVSVQRFEFAGHLAIISMLGIAALGWMMAEEWLAFFVPDSGVATIGSVITGGALLTALVAWHLSLSSHLPRARRIRAGLIVTGVLLAIAGVAALAEDDAFTDIPTFSGIVKPVGARWIPTATVDEFGGVMADLKVEVDELAEEMAAR